MKPMFIILFILFIGIPLLKEQNPEATYVKGYKAWNQLGRYVKKGSKGLAILAPCFRKIASWDIQL